MKMRSYVFIFMRQCPLGGPYTSPLSPLPDRLSFTFMYITTQIGNSRLVKCLRLKSIDQKKYKHALACVYPALILARTRVGVFKLYLTVR